jgi:hypothetical protein
MRVMTEEFRDEEKNKIFKYLRMTTKILLKSIQLHPQLLS